MLFPVVSRVMQSPAQPVVEMGLLFLSAHSVANSRHEPTRSESDPLLLEIIPMNAFRRVKVEKQWMDLIPGDTERAASHYKGPRGLALVKDVLLTALKMSGLCESRQWPVFRRMWFITATRVRSFAEQIERNSNSNPTALNFPGRMDVALNQINVRRMIYLTLIKYSYVVTTI